MQPGGGDSGALLLSPFIKPGTVTTVHYNHFSLLLTIQDVSGSRTPETQPTLSRAGSAPTCSTTSPGMRWRWHSERRPALGQPDFSLRRTRHLERWGTQSRSPRSAVAPLEPSVAEPQRSPYGPPAEVRRGSSPHVPICSSPASRATSRCTSTPARSTTCTADKASRRSFRLQRPEPTLPSGARAKRSYSTEAAENLPASSQRMTSEGFTTSPIGVREHVAKARRERDDRATSAPACDAFCGMSLHTISEPQAMSRNSCPGE